MRSGELRISISTPGDSAGPSRPHHDHFSHLCFHTSPPQLLKERGKMLLGKHPAHPIKVTEQGKEGGVGTEQPSDFRRWKLLSASGSEL